MPRHVPDHFFGHPRPLSTLFHIELWERFSYYGMQSILLIYLYYEVTRGGLGIDQGLAGGIVGIYGGSVYLATILGGWLADRVLGAERTLFYSGIVVMLGHIALALLPGISGLVVGLVCIALGSGGVKSSASSMVGALYEDPQWHALRDAGFSIFYLAVNIGGFFGPLLTGVLQSELGFHYGFGAAALGMAFGLWRYARGRAALPKLPVPNPLSPAQRVRVQLAAVAVIAVVGALFGARVIHPGNFSSVVLGINIVAVLGYFGRMLLGPSFSASEKRHVLAYVPLFLAACVFWMLWFQVFTSVVVYFDETVVRRIGDWEAPVSWSASAQSMWVIILAGTMATLWTKLGDKQPRTPMKFVLSLFVLGAGYYCFVPYIKAGEPMSMLVFVGVLFLVTVAELLISPIAISLATKIAPASFKTQMVAVNFLSLSLGFTAGGVLFDAHYSKEAAADFYVELTVISLVCAVALLVLVPVLNRMLKDVD